MVSGVPLTMIGIIAITFFIIRDARAFANN